MGEINRRDTGDFSGSLTSRIVKALGVFAGVQSASMLCSVVRAKLIALWIGPAGVGLNALLSNTLDLLSQLSQAGIRVSAVRSIAAAGSDERPRMVYALLRWALWLGCGGALMTLLAAPLLSKLTFGNYDSSYMFVILALAVLASAIASGRNAALQGVGMLKKLARLTVISVLISTAAAIPLFYFFRLGAIVWVVTLFAIVQAVVFYVGMPPTGVQSPVSRRDCVSLGMPFIKLGLVLTLSNGLTMISSYVISVFLNRCGSDGTSTVGIYQAGFAIVNNYMGILVSALTVEYFPRLSANIAHRHRSEVLVSHQLVVLMMLLVPGVILFLIFREQIVLILYSTEFTEVVPYLTYAVGGGVLRMVSVCMALCMLAAADSRAYMATELFSSLIGMLLAGGGYMFAGIGGMGMAYLIWYALYTAAVWAVYRFRYGMRIRRRALWILLAGLLLVAMAQTIAAIC